MPRDAEVQTSEPRIESMVRELRIPHPNCFAKGREFYCSSCRLDAEAADLIERLMYRIRYIDNWAEVLERFGSPDETLSHATIIGCLREGRRGPKCPTCSLDIAPGTVHKPGYGSHCITEAVDGR